MSLCEKLGRKKTNIEPSSECIKLLELKGKMNSLLRGVKYVAKSEYSDILPAYKDNVDYFRVLHNSKMLKNYCAQNGIAESEVIEIIDIFDQLERKVDEANDIYINNQMISEKDYLDNILKDVDPVIMLDEDQRKVILTDEDYCLVIAGAGAGKTTTVAAKVKYLVEKKKINPRDILVISFTNKAVGELRQKINKDLNIDFPIATFHSTGNAVLRINDPEPLNIFDGSKLYCLLQDYFKKSILTNEALINNLIMFFASYFEAPYEGADLNEFFNKTAKANYATMRSELDEFRREVVDARTKKKIICTLGLNNPYVLVNGFDRENLFFQVDKPKNKEQYILDYINEHEGDSGIIYCATRKNVDSVYELLKSKGISVSKYHAGMSATDRKKMQDDFVFYYSLHRI